MNDGRLNVSAGLAAYIKTVVQNEFLIHEKKNDIPMYAYYAYKLVNQENVDPKRISIDGQPIESCLDSLSARIKDYEDNKADFVDIVMLDLELMYKVDLMDYEEDQKTWSEYIKTELEKKTDISEYNGTKTQVETNKNNIKTNSEDIATLKSTIAKLEARIKALEDTAKETEETS